MHVAIRMFRQRTLVAPLLTLAGGALCGCGGGASSDPSNAAVETVGTVQSAVSATDVCALVNGLGSAIQTPPLSGTPLGNVNVSCGADEVRQIYYNGSELLTNSLEDLFIMPYVTAGAYACGLADADGASVDGTLGGGWGVKSQFNITTRDPAHGHVAGRRVGSVVLFGASAKLLVQDIDWQWQPELGTNSIPNWWGAYGILDSTGIHWDFDLSVTFPIGAIQVNIHPQFHSRGPTVTRTNGAVFFDPNKTAFDPGPMVPVTNKSMTSTAPDLTYSHWANCINGSTRCFPFPRSNVPNSLFQLEHLLGCSGAPDNLTDNILPFYSPYGGAGCSSQDYIDFDVLSNWFQYGRPSNVGSFFPAAEPDHNIGSTTDLTNLENNATFWGSVEVKTAFDIELVSINLDTTLAIASRDGFAIRQTHTLPAELGQTGSTVNVMTDLNAQSAATLDVKADIDFGDLFPTIHVDFPWNLGDTHNREAMPGGSITNLQYPSITDSNPFTALNQYQVKGVNKANPDTARLQCVTSTATTATPVNPDPPGPFLKNVASNAVDVVHPCHVKTCTDAQHEVDYEWNTTNKSLARTSSGACSICSELRMNMCDVNGNVLQDPNNPGKPILIVNGILNPLPASCIR